MSWYDVASGRGNSGGGAGTARKSAKDDPQARQKADTAKARIDPYAPIQFTPGSYLYALLLKLNQQARFKPAPGWETPHSGRLYFQHGTDVYVLRDGKKIPVNLGMDFLKGDLIVTSGTTRVTLGMQDGSEVDVLPNSRLVITHDWTHEKRPSTAEVLWAVLVGRATIVQQVDMAFAGSSDSADGVPADGSTRG